MNNQLPPSGDEPISKLETAIQNLETFTNQNELEPFPHVQDLEVRGNLIRPKTSSDVSKTIDLFAALFTKRHQKHTQKRHQVQNALLESIEFLKTHYRIIIKRQHGTEEEQNWAKWAQNTINRYNKLVNKAAEEPKKLGDRVAQFVYRTSGLTVEIRNTRIDIPHEFTVYYKGKQIEGQIPAQEATVNKVSTLLQHQNITLVEPTDRQRVAFQMKAIKSAENLGLPQAICLALTSMMREAPINAISTPVAGNDEAAVAAIISLEQTLTPLPGEEIHIEGAFEHVEKALIPSKPITGSFGVSAKAKQTGFPHPSQHNGWALSHVLIPDYPFSLEFIPLFNAVYKAKGKIAAELLPAGKLNEQAKKLLKIKKEAFDSHAKSLLGYHESLARVIVTSSGQPIEKSERIIADFFEGLKPLKSSYELLTATYHLMNLFFVELPHENLYTEWQEEANPHIIGGNAKSRYEASFKLLDQAIDRSEEEVHRRKQLATHELEKKTLAFILALGPIIGRASHSIILQYLSEKINYRPLPLSLFEQKMQTCLFKQLMEFHEELDLDLDIPYEQALKLIQKRLEDQLRKDISIFKADSTDSVHSSAAKIAHELELYYTSRHFSKTDSGKKIKYE
jgi:hypothetical protein